MYTRFVAESKQGHCVHNKLYFKYKNLLFLMYCNYVN